MTGSLHNSIDKGEPWQLFCNDGSFGVCIECTGIIHCSTVFHHNQPANMQPTYMQRGGQKISIGEQQPSYARYHIQASIYPPQWYHSGVEGAVTWRGTAQREDHIRPWLKAINELCTHQFPTVEHSCLVWTASNRTPSWTPGTTRTVWYRETIITMIFRSTTYAEDAVTLKVVRDFFKLNGTHSFSHPLTLQGLHYEVIPDHNHLRTTAPMDPLVRALNPTEEITLISGLIIGITPMRVIQVLTGTGHINHEGIINIIWHPGTPTPVPGLSFGIFRPYLSSMTIIAAKGSEVFTRNPRFGCTDLASIAPPGRNTALAIAWKKIDVYQGFANMIKTNKEAFSARHPRGSHIHTEPTLWKATENPRHWPLPGGSTPSPSSSSLTSSRASTGTDLERLSQSESSIATLQNLLYSITTRLDNQELKNAATDASISAIDNNVLILKTTMAKHSTDVTAIASGYCKMQTSMDAILKILQASHPASQAQSGQTDDNRKC
jgi:hypothetical protein